MGLLINKANYQDIDGVMWGRCWQANQPSGHTKLTYSFPTSSDVYDGYADVRSFEAFNSQQMTAAIKALANFDAVSNLDFVFEDDSNRDYIQDFKRGTDDIDLKGINAKSFVSGNNTFKWIGQHSFNDVKDELRYIGKGASCIVQGDVNGDGKANFEIMVKVGTLGSGDFLL
jgi:hypothetical protein